MAKFIIALLWLELILSPPLLSLIISADKLPWATRAIHISDDGVWFVSLGMLLLLYYYCSTEHQWWFTSHDILNFCLNAHKLTLMPVLLAPVSISEPIRELAAWRSADPKHSFAHSLSSVGEPIGARLSLPYIVHVLILASITHMFKLVMFVHVSSWRVDMILDWPISWQLIEKEGPPLWLNGRQSWQSATRADELQHGRADELEMSYENSIERSDSKRWSL